MPWDCQRFQENIFAYIDGMLKAEEAACFLQHSKECPACAMALQEAQAFEDGMLHLLAPVEPPKDFVANVMAALPKAAPTPVPAKVVTFPKKRVFGGLGAVAAAAVLVLGITTMGVDGDNPVLPVAPSINIAGIQDVIAQIPGNIGETPVTPGTPETPDQPVVVVAEVPTVNNPGTAVTPNTTPQKPVVDNPPTGQTVTPPANDNQVTTTQLPEGSGVLALPKAAYGVAAEGTLSSRLVASFEKDSIYAPKLSTNVDEVSYYTEDKDGIYLWRSSLSNPGEPENLGLAKNSDSTLLEQLPKNTCPTYDVNTSLFSPDGTMMAMNLRGDSSGVWISDVGKENNPWQLCGEGGGKILAWAPNGSKLLFTDKEGKLYVGYPVEKRIFIVSDQVVKDLAWGKDSKTVVMTVQEKGSSKTDLYTVQIP